jgi:hypothetical protein
LTSLRSRQGERLQSRKLGGGRGASRQQNESDATRKEVDGETKEKEDKDDKNYFFNNFKKMTGGKNSQPGWL